MLPTIACGIFGFSLGMCVMFICLMMKNSDKFDFLIFDPTPKDIHNTCLSYRHDYRLMSPDKQKEVQTQAQFWLEAWQKTIRYRKKS